MTAKCASLPGISIYMTLRLRAGKGLPKLKSVNKNKISGAEETAQSLRELTALAEGTDSVPSTHMAAYNYFL